MNYLISINTTEAAFVHLEVVGGELVVADFNLGLDLLLVAVLLSLLHSLLLGHVGAGQARLLLAARHDLLDLAGLADVPGHGPAVLAVAVPLGLLVPRAPLQLAHLGKRKMKEKDRGERKLNF